MQRVRRAADDRARSRRRPVPVELAGGRFAVRWWCRARGHGPVARFDAGRLGGADRRRARRTSSSRSRTRTRAGRLIGLEVVYATSSGSTVTRKASWSSSQVVAPGRRILIVNGGGSYVAWATRPTPVASRQRVARSRCACSAARSSTRSPGATRRTHSSKAAPPGLRRRPPVSKGDRVALAAMASTRTTTPRTGSCRVRPGPQNLASAAVPGPTPTPSPTRCRRRADRRSDGHAHADAVADP